MEHQVTPNDLTDQSRSNICGTLRREKGRNGPKVCEKSKHKFYKKSSSQVKSGGVIRKSMTIKMENILPINLQRSHSLNPFLVSSKVKKTTFAGGRRRRGRQKGNFIVQSEIQAPFYEPIKGNAAKARNSCSPGFIFIVAVLCRLKTLAECKQRGSYLMGENLIRERFYLLILLEKL